MYRLTDVNKDYPKGRGVVHALRGVNVVIEDGGWLAIQGPTGHGKAPCCRSSAPSTARPQAPWNLTATI
jgi:ABC-type dipeptide/oligopeptide/nickel transport system ATPase subunit